MTRHGMLLVCALRGGITIAMAIAGTSNADALTPALAKKCRDMALHAYPYQLPGTGPGNAQNEIRFYKDCLAKNGDMTPPPPAPSNGTAPR